MRVAVHPDAVSSEEPVTFKVVYQWNDGTERDEDGELIEETGRPVIRLPSYIDKV